MNANQNQTISDVLTYATAQLTHSSSARLDAELLLAQILQQPREYLHTWPERELTHAQRDAFSLQIKKRREGWPVAYLIGHQAFWTLDLRVTPATLIPRPETELLVETALTLFAAESNRTVIDLGTGSGAIALAIAKERPQWQLHATDISQDALAIAQENAQGHAITTVTFHHGNWIEALPLDLRADLIISNPPYIAKDDPHLQQGDVRFEPTRALVAGEDGLAAIRTILAKSPSYMTPVSWLLLEHGYDQANAVRNLFSQYGFSDIMQLNDLAGHGRVTLGKHSL